jgi:hypothetical protein
MHKASNTGQERRIAMSVSMPLSTYLALTDRSQRSGQSLSFVVNRLLSAAINLERDTLAARKS